MSKDWALYVCEPHQLLCYCSCCAGHHLANFSLQGQGGNVAYAGHLGGAAVGALAFLGLRRGRMRW